MGSIEVSKRASLFNQLSTMVIRFAGSPTAFLSAFVIILIWGMLGPFFYYSDTWLLSINTTTTIITFLMVFIIQQSQNKDTLALHLKLNELIAANKGASNRLVSAEDLTEEELITLKKFYRRLSSLSQQEENQGATHSIDERETGDENKRQVVKNVKET